MGGSSSKNSSYQRASAELMQNYAGSCDINCTNKIKNLNANIINSVLKGDIAIKQTCAVNANCTFDTTQGSTTDILFKAANAATTSPSWWGTFNFSTNDSYQDIRQNVQNYVSQKCNISSLNDIEDVNIYAENSNIGGDIIVEQKGEIDGGCALNANMMANVTASGSIDNCASAGKKSKKMCGGKGSSTALSLIIILPILFILLTMLVKFYNDKGTKPIGA